MSLALAAALFLMAGCSEAEPTLPGPDDEIFAGLDPAVVREVLGHPVVTAEILTNLPAESYAGAAQANVSWFMTCRSLQASLLSWMRTGVQPPVVTTARATTPAADNARVWDLEDASYADVWASGDPLRLRELLVYPYGCADATPATPGDYAGPTIRDAIEAGL